MTHADSPTIPLRPRFPDSPEDQAVLRLRAQQLAKTKKDPLQTIHLEQLLHVHLEAEAHYGIPYRFIDEIIPIGDITLVPFTSPVIKGVINHHGQLLTIIDINYLLTNKNLIVNPASRILVVQGAGLTVGIPVKYIEGKVLYEPGKLTASLHTHTEDVTPMIVGIHAGHISVLNMDALLTHPTLTMGKSNNEHPHSLTSNQGVVC